MHEKMRDDFNKLLKTPEVGPAQTNRRPGSSRPFDSKAYHHAQKIQELDIAIKRLELDYERSNIALLESEKTTELVQCLIIKVVRLFRRIRYKREHLDLAIKLVKARGSSEADKEIEEAHAEALLLNKVIDKKITSLGIIIEETKAFFDLFEKEIQTPETREPDDDLEILKIQYKLRCSKLLEALSEVRTAILEATISKFEMDWSHPEYITGGAGFKKYPYSSSHHNEYIERTSDPLGNCILWLARVGLLEEEIQIFDKKEEWASEERKVFGPTVFKKDFTNVRQLIDHIFESLHSFTPEQRKEPLVAEIISNHSGLVKSTTGDASMYPDNKRKHSNSRP
jgi:hypothetical protein